MLVSRWINNWKKFVQSDAGVHPGPVDNSVLLDRDQRPLRNLIRGNDYRGVNKRISEHWFKIYGGGPEIPRKSVDIYEDDGRPQLATDSHARRRSVEAR